MQSKSVSKQLKGKSEKLLWNELVATDFIRTSSHQIRSDPEVICKRSLRFEFDSIPMVTRFLNELSMLRLSRS